MYRKRIVLVLLTLALCAMFGCGKPGASGNPNAGEGQTANPGSPADPSSPGAGATDPGGHASQTPGSGGDEGKSPVQPADPIRERMNNMSLEEKIGQMVIVGLDGYTADEHALAMIDRYHVGGFILFKNNIKDSGQALALINDLKAANAKNPAPLFFGVDQEGGRVNRMPDDFAPFPTNAAIGKVNNASFSKEIGKVLAKEIKALGFNMDFAPVLDINSNPDNPVIGDRSFGAQADLVSKLGVQTMEGIQAEQVAAVVKHFPGHGDTSVDSHKGLPVVNNDLKRLQSFELVPFAEAIRNGADAVMVAHILLPKLDAQNPSSLSEAIITDLLRKQLQFGGVVMTDDLTMGAIANEYGAGEAAVKAVRAGSDIVLVCHENAQETAALDALKQAADRGELTPERIDESVYRILQLKQKIHASDKQTASVPTNEINDAIHGVLDKYMKR